MGSVDGAADPLIIMRRVEGARGGIVLESGPSTYGYNIRINPLSLVLMCRINSYRPRTCLMMGEA